MKDSPHDILNHFATDAGLASQFEMFPHTGTLSERFAAHPLLMAPMAGVSDSAWRLMARAGGADLAYSEMVSVAGIHFGGEKTWKLVDPVAEEHDVAVQLFGSKPEQFSEAAEQVVRRLGSRLALLDINMACPVPKVVRKGEGAALMADVRRAAAIVKATREGVRIGSRALGIEPVPVTCKIRRGINTGTELASACAKVLAEAGADAIAVHGRFADQLYRGAADWGVIQRVCKSVCDVPVIASGDILTAEDAVRVRNETGASAVMIARGTYGNPWIFSDAVRLSAGEPIPKHSFEQRLSAFRCHVCLLAALGAHMVRARSLAGWYLKGVPNAAAWRDRAMRCSTETDFLALADAIGAYLRESSHDVTKAASS